MYNSRNSECWKECILGQAGVGVWCCIYTGQLPSSVPYKLETHDNPWIRVVVAALGEHRDLFCFIIDCVGEGSLQMALLYERRVLNDVLVSEVGGKNALIIIST